MTLNIPISPLDSPTKEVVIYFSNFRDLGEPQKTSHSPGLSHLMRTNEDLINKLMQREKVVADKFYSASNCYSLSITLVNFQL